MSDVNPSVIRDDQKVAKSDLREQLQIIKNELEALESVTSLARKMAFNDLEFDTL